MERIYSKVIYSWIEKRQLWAFLKGNPKEILIKMFKHFRIYKTSLHDKITVNIRNSRILSIKINRKYLNQNVSLLKWFTLLPQNKSTEKIFFQLLKNIIPKRIQQVKSQ